MKGFTLIELIVVILVLGLLVGLVGPQVVGHVGESRTQVARAQIEMLATGLDLYRLDSSAYPTTEQGLRALWEKPAHGAAPLNWRGPYVRKPIPADPWGNAYVYRSPGASDAAYELLSYGSDGRPGGVGEAADLSAAQ